MNPEDFNQFNDPRVRDVMSAAANLVETLASHQPYAHASLAPIHVATDALKTALFAAQHSLPKITRNRETPGSREFWSKAEASAEEVATWSEWKRTGINVAQTRDTPREPEPQLANFCKQCGHIAWLVHLKDGRCLDCQDVFEVLEAAKSEAPKCTCGTCTAGTDSCL